jgi:hypothetical protein
VSSTATAVIKDHGRLRQQVVDYYKQGVVRVVGTLWGTHGWQPPNHGGDRDLKVAERPVDVVE